MNLQCSCPSTPLRVLLLNPLLPSGQLLAMKILSGYIFGSDQKIDLTLLMYATEVAAAEALKIQLQNCAFGSANIIELSVNIPCITDADVFCFITNLPNPNCVDFGKTNNIEEINTLSVLITVANNLNNVPIVTDEDNNVSQANIDKELGGQKIKHKPIIIADGLVTMSMLYNTCNNIPHEYFYCPSPLEGLSKMVLGDYLKAQCNTINDTLVWAGNDEVFYVEVLKPVIINKPVENESQCDREVIGKQLMQTLNMDHSQFSASWMKKDFIEKIKTIAMKNPYGPVYRASDIARTLKVIWSSKNNNGQNTYTNIGVISDGSYETLKGAPYVLPLIFNSGSWHVNKCYESDSHVKQEVKRISKMVKKNMDMMKRYCKIFAENDVTATTKSSLTIEQSTSFSGDS